VESKGQDSQTCGGRHQLHICFNHRIHHNSFALLFCGGEKRGSLHCGALLLDTLKPLGGEEKGRAEQSNRSFQSRNHLSVVTGGNCRRKKESVSASFSLGF
jgi:hypothetical protein